MKWEIPTYICILVELQAVVGEICYYAEDCLAEKISVVALYSF